MLSPRLARQWGIRVFGYAAGVVLYVNLALLARDDVANGYLVVALVMTALYLTALCEWRAWRQI